jgi:transposase
MKKLEMPSSNTMRLAIQQEIARTEESRYDHRLHGILLMTHGLDTYTVGQYLGQHPVTVQRWWHRFMTCGFAGLREGGRPGRPTRLGALEWERLDADLRCSPRDFDYSQTLWDGKLLSHHLAARYGVRLGVRQCQRMFHRLEFRRRKPRPAIAQGDPAAQAAYKKTAASGRRPGPGSVESG